MKTRRVIILFSLVSTFFLLLPMLAQAEDVIMNDNGYIYMIDEKAFPYSTLGDILEGVGLISSTNPVINVDLSVNEMTWSLADLTVADQFVIGTRIYTNFSGGTLTLFVDPAMNADYGTDPPNPSAPVTFTDGDLFLTGVITTATMLYDTYRQFGSLVALVNFTNGPGMVDLEEPNGNIVQFTFGPDDPNIPVGYVLQAIGSITVPSLCTVEGKVEYEYNAVTCEKCDGITELVLRYKGSGDISSVISSSEVILTVNEDLLTITPAAFLDKLPKSTEIQIGCDIAYIHTSCSQSIVPGNIIEDFSVVDVTKIMVPCEATRCDGMTRLALKYNGVNDLSSLTVTGDATATVDGDIITILPVADELGGNTKVTVGNNQAMIHTSCSQPLEVGFVFGEFEVVEVEKQFGGGGDAIPEYGPVVGATIDLVDGNGNIYNTLTDEYGDYIFFDVATESLMVSAVVPLGYMPLSPTELELVCGLGAVGRADFLFERLATQDKPRSTGFWKHQIVQAIKGKQRGVQVPAGELLELFEMIHGRFDQYFEIFIPVVTLEDFYGVMKVKKPTQYDKARKQFAGLLLNVVSNRLSSWQFVSSDYATVSQAITYISDLLTDDDPSNDELAKDIAEAINRNLPVAPGTIPLDISYIAYYRDKSKVIEDLGNYPNPFNPVTTIKYNLREAVPVNLTVYNVLGQKIRKLVPNQIQVGSNIVKWDGKNDAGAQLSSGVYFYQLKAGAHIVTRRMVLMR